MTVVYLLLLGLIQGVAEFLPVSSSGHLALFECFFFRVERATAFGVFLHLGTFLAVLLLRRKDVLEVVVGAFGALRAPFKGGRPPEKRRLWGGAGNAAGPDCPRLGAAASVDGARDRKAFRAVVFSTVPLILLGIADLLLKIADLPGAGDLVDRYFASRPPVVGALLVLNGALLLTSDSRPERRSSYTFLSVREAIFVGVFQLFAVLPGLSRSGMTIVACRLLGLDRRESVRYSFLLSLPAVAGALISALPDLFGESGEKDLPVTLLIASAAVAFAVGAVSIKLLERCADRYTLRPFAVYCGVVGCAAAAASLLIG